ncbi:class I SAM-dependent methyltransferase [Microseira wollei]|uniref:Methyltransferase type 11 n=1 Tax=Microseira wollei NIES-4236 TaxID=2530354 RepID=A0AAV3XMD3_9CYAN|nr:class I SAM-dependent methyltransferase [Microseira wollei]GET41951.1 methyltransferase type 11 [Microseira wollei NIES-4236]
MENQAAELKEKVRQQFETGPYPRIPLEYSPKDDLNFLFNHSMVTAYYLKYQKVVETEGKIILDAGCGSGYKALALAEANPGAKIIGIDISEKSVELARTRLQQYGFENAEFYAMSIEDLPSLGMQFDYINNDEVLYLLTNPVIGLKAMKAVLKPEGIIRSNLHSDLQRTYFFRSQQVFKLMGLMDENPREMEIDLVRDTFQALKDDVILKARTWNSVQERTEEWFLANYLLQNDKGFTIPEMFSALRAADLEFLTMVNWQRWDLMQLFKEPDNLPVFLGISLPEISVEQRLHLYELLHPVNRLLDFWCTQPQPTNSVVPVAEWTPSDWQGARVHLHPLLRIPQIKEELIECITKYRPFEISRYIAASPTAAVWVDSRIAACLLPLWEGVQPFTSLVERWCKIESVHPVTLETVSDEVAIATVERFLKTLEPFLYVLLEPSARSC